MKREKWNPQINKGAKEALLVWQADDSHGEGDDQDCSSPSWVNQPHSALTVQGLTFLLMQLLWDLLQVHYRTQQIRN